MCVVRAGLVALFGLCIVVCAGCGEEEAAPTPTGSVPDATPDEGGQPDLATPAPEDAPAPEDGASPADLPLPVDVPGPIDVPDPGDAPGPVDVPGPSDLPAPEDTPGPEDAPAPPDALLDPEVADGGSADAGPVEPPPAEGCGDGVCTFEETPAACPADCCDPALCAPDSGAPLPGADAAGCAGLPDGAACGDDDPTNGQEQCFGGVCLLESPHCLCGSSGELPEPQPEPNDWALPEEVAPPAWQGAIPGEPTFDAHWALRRIDVSPAWEVTMGSPEIVLGVVDTGCAEVADLAGRIVAQTDLVDEDDVAEDALGHGTLLATIAAGAADGQGVVGVAPGVSIVCARVAEASTTDYAELAAGIDWAVAAGAHVVLVGFGGHGTGPGLEALTAAVEAAALADVLVVAPAGSAGGANLDVFPAALPGVLSVAASDDRDLPMSGSDLSPATWLVAPGERVIGVAPAGETEMREGSSVAAALVAGAAALVRSAAPALDAVAVRAVLRGTGHAVPIEGFEDFLRARRLDVGAAVAAAVGAAPTIDVSRVTLLPASALPGQPLLARVRVENAGVVPVAEVALDLQVTGGVAEPFEAVGLAPGDTIELEIVILPDADVQAVEVSASAGAKPGVAEAVMTPTVVHEVAISHAEIAPAAPGDATLQVVVEVENRGNAAEAARTLRLAAHPYSGLALVEVPALGPGERATVSGQIGPFPATSTDNYQVDAYLDTAPGQASSGVAVASLRFRFVAGLETAGTAYMQLNGENLIADAPWRTQLSTIPVLFFYARTRWADTSDIVEDIEELILLGVWELILPDLQERIRMGYVRVRNPNGPRSGEGPIIYEDHYDAAPVTFPAGGRVVRESGGIVGTGDVVWTQTPLDGAHRVLFVPTSALTYTASGSMSDPAATGAFLEVEFRYKTALIQLFYSDRSRRMLGTEIDSDPLPALAEEDHYFDAHYHTIAEWYRGGNLTGPAKAYGGPIQMLLAASASLGFIPAGQVQTWGSYQELVYEADGKVITTDHSTFFDDADAPEAGPSWNILWPASAPSGSQELEVYRNIFGMTAGEEVSLLGSNTAASALGRHALAYRCKHVAGSWGLGQLPASFGLCTPTYHNLLSRIACNPGSPSACASEAQTTGGACIGGESPQTVVGHTFAAHPFAGGFTWDDAILRDALSLPPNDNNRDFVTIADEYVFRGYQFWNARPAQHVASSFSTTSLRDFNPYPGATHDSFFMSWSTWECAGDAGYREAVHAGLATFMTHVRDGLSTVFVEDEMPRARFFRKLFFIGGSDAHGDFGYTSDLLATPLETIATWFGQATLSDSAHGRPRTYVLGGTIDDMRQGRSVVTDGPVVELEIDGDGRGDLDPETGTFDWHDDEPSFEDCEDDCDERGLGRMGGGGVRDGARTVLVGVTPLDEESQSIRVALRCKNVGDFGGQAPSKVELVVSGEAGTDDPHKCLVGEGQACDAPSVCASAGGSCVAVPNDDTPFEPLFDAQCDGSWYEQTIKLGATASDPDRPLSHPVAVSAHVAVGDSCPGIYDAYTNPVWVAPVRASVLVTLTKLKNVEGKFLMRLSQELSPTLPITLYFPISMREEEVEGFIKQIDPATGELIDLTGGVDNEGKLQAIPNPTKGWGDDPKNGDPAETKDSRLTFWIPPANPIRGDLIAADMADERFVLVVRRKVSPGDVAPCDDYRLCDALGNPLSVFTMRFDPEDCVQKSCPSGYKYCYGTCQCVPAYQCPIGAIYLFGCECCLSYSCFPLPCFCTYCASKIDQSYLYCDDVSPCSPNCDGKECGVSCGVTCGECSDGEECVGYQCECQPDCSNKLCGDDGCGGSCGECAAGFECEEGQCQCVPDCAGAACGDDGCEGTCGSCAANEVCSGGACACAPSCVGKECGDDGCGAGPTACGECDEGIACVDGTCQACVPDCAGKGCGGDGCEGLCGVCSFGSMCVDGGCAPDPSQEAWPMFGGAPGHGGQSTGTAPAAPEPVTTFATGAAVVGSAVVGEGDVTYIGSTDHHLYALTAAGAELWSYDAGGAVQAAPAVLTNDTIVVGSADGQLHGVSPTGGALWAVPLGGAVRSAPVALPPGIIFVGSDGGAVHRLTLGGVVVWSFDTAGAVTGSPAVSGDRVVIGSHTGVVYGLTLAGTQSWSFVTGGAIEGSAALGAGNVALVGSSDGSVYAIDDNGLLVWSFATGASVRSSPALGADGTVYIGSDDGSLYALTPASGAVVWAAPLGGSVGSSPLVDAAGTVVVGSDGGSLFALTAAGDVAWEYGAGAAIQSSPALTLDGRVVVGSDSGQVIMIGP